MIGHGGSKPGSFAANLLNSQASQVRIIVHILLPYLLSLVG